MEVASWFSTDPERILGGRPDAVTVDDLERLVGQSEEESEILDFKVGFDPDSVRAGGFTAAQEFAKDVAALAKARGGLIVIGILDRNGVACERTPITGTTPELLERRLRQALRNFLSPLANVQMTPERHQ